MLAVRLSACSLSVILFAALPALADGGFFYLQGESTDLAQTRQEVVIAFHRDAADTADQATYVLATRYSGQPGELAWVIPLPATPTDVTAHADNTLFDELDYQAEPYFMVIGPYDGGFGCTCAGPALNAAGEQGGLVTVEASGQAGIFSWAALTSTGSSALLTWLNDKGFALPSQAGDILDDYVQRDMHFLAIRVTEPGQVQSGDRGQIEIPPIQFTCQTSMRFYPMAISRISAADETEVLIYVLADQRAEAANVTNAVIDPDNVAYDATSPSLTNYESLFTARITELGGTALITEFAGPYYGLVYRQDVIWPDAPQGVSDLTYLTRMRTVIARDNMTIDFTFQDAAGDDAVDNVFFISETDDLAAASLAGPPLAALLIFGLFRSAMLGRRRYRLRLHDANR